MFFLFAVTPTSQPRQPSFRLRSERPLTCRSSAAACAEPGEKQRRLSVKVEPNPARQQDNPSYNLIDKVLHCLFRVGEEWERLANLPSAPTAGAQRSASETGGSVRERTGRAVAGRHDSGRVGGPSRAEEEGTGLPGGDRAEGREESCFSIAQDPRRRLTLFPFLFWTFIPPLSASGSESTPPLLPIPFRPHARRPIATRKAATASPSIGPTCELWESSRGKAGQDVGARESGGGSTLS